MDIFKADVEERLGWKLEPARPYHFTSNIDKFGWSTGYNGKHHFTIFIENGRVEDIPGKDFKTGLREIAKAHKGKFRLTANQHLVLADVTDAELNLMKKLLAKFGLDNYAHSGLRLSSSACVAFPTCGTRPLPGPVPPRLTYMFFTMIPLGLAMAESERVRLIILPSRMKITGAFTPSVSSHSYRQGRSNLRGKRAPKRFHRNADDWLPEWMRETLRRRQVYSVHNIIYAVSI